MSSNYVNIPAYGDPHWQSPVATVFDLPANGNAVGDVRVVTADDSLWIWNGSSWIVRIPAAPGTVTNFSFSNLNGLAGVVTNSSTTPNLTLSPGAGSTSTNYWRGDGTWGNPPGVPGSPTDSIQTNSGAGTFAGDSNFTYASQLQTLSAPNLGQTLVSNKGLILQNPTPSTGSGPTLQQSSPPMIFAGHSWQASAPAGDKVSAWRMASFSNVPAGGAPSSSLKVEHTVGANLSGAWTTSMQIDFDQVRFFSTAFFSNFSASGSGFFTGANLFSGPVTIGSGGGLNCGGSANFTGSAGFVSLISTSITCSTLQATSSIEADRVHVDTDIRVGTNQSLATIQGKALPSASIPAPGSDVVTVQTPALPSGPSGDAFLFVAPITNGTNGGGASEDTSGGAYVENGSTYDLTAVNYYFDGTTTWYSPVQAIGSFTDGNGGLNFSINFSWSATTSGGGYTGTLLGRQINGGGYSWYDAGPIGVSGSILDDGSGSPYNWGSASAPGTASPDFIATGQTYSFDCYSVLTSPSGGAYFILGDSPSQGDPNDGNPYQISLGNGNLDTVKFVQTAPAAGSAFDVPSGSRTINTATSSDSLTTTPNDYRYAADPMATAFYYRVTGYNQVAGHTYYGTPGAWNAGSADPSNPWIAEFTYSPVTPVLGYIVEYSPDSFTATKYVDFGNQTDFFDDALRTWTGGAATLTPTSYTRPVFYYEADVLSGDPSGVCKIGSAGGVFKTNNLDSSDNVVSSQSFDEAGGITIGANLTVTGVITAQKEIVPAQLADTFASNNSIYYSTTAGKLVYKDSGGVVHNLY